jgi:quercetin dioxygenase-like cupin family protein
MDIRNDHFATEAEAVAEIEAAGYWPLTVDFPPEENEDHWHDFDSMVFVLEGELSLTDAETGETCVCGPGTRVVAKSGVLHREAHRGYKAVVGLSVDPSTLTQPINKPPRGA